MSRPCRQTLLEGTSLQSKQTNKERKQERKQQQQQQIVVRLQLPVFSSRQETPWLAHDRVLVRRQPMLHYIYVFLRKTKVSAIPNLPPPSLSLRWGHLIYILQTSGAFQSSPFQSNRLLLRTSKGGDDHHNDHLHHHTLPLGTKLARTEQNRTAPQLKHTHTHTPTTSLSAPSYRGHCVPS